MPADLILPIVLAYLIGSVPFAVILTRRGGTDVRRIGSGNPGAANVFRVTGAKSGVVVAALDITKGAAGVVLARWMGGGNGVTAAAGFTAVVGHVFPVWLGFRGGKGVATAWGAFSMLTPIAGALAFGVFVTTLWITRYVSLGSMLASAALPSFAYLVGSSGAIVIAAAAAAVLILVRHRTNISRLRRGTERRLFTAESAAASMD